MNTICAGIVTYNPDVERLIENLSAVTVQVDKVYIVDNGSENIDRIVELNGKYLNLEIVCFEKNFGIAKALNEIFKQASCYDWVLTLDQDTIINSNLISEYRAYLSRPDVVSLCPTIIERINAEIPNSNNLRFEEVTECITSANLVKRSVWEEVKGFNEELFIDQVDFEFCYKIRRKGYKIFRVNSTSILHEIGNPIQKKFLWKKVNIYNHSAFRKYYIFRNGWYIAHNYPQESKNLHLRRYLFIRLLFIILYEDCKKEKLINAFKGLKDSKFIK